jgi:hypothetical protein
MECPYGEGNGEVRDLHPDGRERVKMAVKRRKGAVNGKP